VTPRRAVLVLTTSAARRAARSRAAHHASRQALLTVWEWSRFAGVRVVCGIVILWLYCGYTVVSGRSRQPVFCSCVGIFASGHILYWRTVTGLEAAVRLKIK